MKYLVKIFSLLLILGVWSCGNRKPDYDKRLVAAHELLKSNADSAFRVLNQMNVNDFETEHDRAYYAYNYTVALDWLNVHSVDDSLLKVAIDYYSAHGDSAMKAKVYYYAADVYDDMGDREQAICYYNKALEVAPIDSVILKASIYSKWTFMQNNDNAGDETLELYNNVKKYAREAGAVHLIADAEIHQGWNHLSNGKSDSAVKHYKEALRIAKSENYDYMKFSIFNKLAYCYTLKNENDKAMFYVREAAKYVETITDKRYLNETLCNIYINLKKWDEADSCLIAAKLDTTDLAYKVIFYDVLSLIKYGKGDYKIAWEIEKRHTVCLDSFHKKIAKNNSAEFQKKYDSTKVKLENSELKLKSQSQKMVIIYLVLVFLLCGMVVSYFIYNKSKKDKAKIQAKDEVIAEMVVTLQEEVNEKHLIREELADKEALIEENKRKVFELSESLLEKDVLLQDIRDQRKELKSQILEMNDVVKKIRKMTAMKTTDVSRKTAVLDKEELELLFKALDCCRNGVISKLRSFHPELTSDELCLCCLLSLKIPSSKIALFLNVSEDTLRQRKSRMRRGKLGLNDEVTVEDYLAELALEDKDVSQAPGLLIG